MPDSFEHMPAHGMRIPAAALTSLAGNVDAHHKVFVADLILAQNRVRAVIEQLACRFEPDLIGLSVMTFQRRTALKIVDLLRRLRPEARIVAGGYDPSLAPHAYAGAVDFLVRGEGEITFRELVRAMERRCGYGRIQGLSYREGDEFVHNPDRPPNRLDEGQIRLPNRDARVLGGYTLMGRPIDVVETSRGCTFNCSFCSIVTMRGRNFHTYDLARVLQDIRDARERGARSIFIVDDNITLNIPRFKAICSALIEARLNKIEYVVQAMTSAIANHGEDLTPLMRRAGFRFTSFLGLRTWWKAIYRSCGRAGRTSNTPRAALPETRRSGPSSICTATAFTWSEA